MNRSKKPTRGKNTSNEGNGGIRDMLIPSDSLDKIKFLNESQRDFYQTIMDKEITFCLGPAGTAKSFVACYAALNLLVKQSRSKNYIYDRIIIVRPAVESEEKLGFLPGELEEKMAPYLSVFYHTIDEILVPRVTDEMGLLKPSKHLTDAGFIKNEPIAFLRGKTLNHSIVLIDEAQNMTKGQLTLVLSRIGRDSKMIFCGDTKQTDIGKRSALESVALALTSNDIPEIGLHYMRKEDIVRNRLIEKMLEVLED